LLINTYTPIPTKKVGPIKINTDDSTFDVRVPLATYEYPLWPSVSRGARATRDLGINVAVIDECMTRSILVEANDCFAAKIVSEDILSKQDVLRALVASTSRYATFKKLDCQIVGRLLYLRIAIYPGEASGHNMATKAAEAILNWLLAEYKLKYISISGNMCADKKVSAANGLLGRGKYVIAEARVSDNICSKLLRSSPHLINELNLKKNLLGCNVAGSIRTANAHFANMLLAIYLATGQDAANIIESSQGFVHTEVLSNSLYFSVTLPNIIVGTVGNGKDLQIVREHLHSMKCSPSVHSCSSKRLAVITAATVLCGELSLLAAQTNPGELMRSHSCIERRSASKESLAGV